MENNTKRVNDDVNDIQKGILSLQSYVFRLHVSFREVLLLTLLAMKHPSGISYWLILFRFVHSDFFEKSLEMIQKKWINKNNQSLHTCPRTCASRVTVASQLISKKSRFFTAQVFSCCPSWCLAISRCTKPKSFIDPWCVAAGVEAVVQDT